MRELKRVLLAPGLWLLLLGLLLGNLFLTVTEDRNDAGFYQSYNREVAWMQTHPSADAVEAIDAELTHIQMLSLLRRWIEEGGDEYDAEELSAYYGADFAQRAAAGELKISDTALAYCMKRQNVYFELREQLAYLREYPEYLNAVHANAKQMGALAIFGGSFSARNIEKTDRDFPKSVRIKLDNNYSLEALVMDRLGGYSLLVYVIAVVLAFLNERKRGLWSLIHGAPGGRARLALRRAFVLLLACAVGTAVLLGGKLLLISLRCGGWGDLSRNVQSSPAFRDFPWVMTVRQFLWRFFALRLFGVWLAGLILWAILQAVNHLPLAITAAGLALAVEYSLFRFIPDSYAIVVLRYVNLFALVDVPTVALHYLNLNLFGVPVQGFLLSLRLSFPLALALLGANLLLAAKKKPVSRQNPILSVFDRLRRPFSRAVGRLRLLGMELFKLLWLQKGALVLLLLAVYVFGVLNAPPPDTELYDTELSGLSASMQGPITEDALRALDTKIAEYSAWEPTEAIVRQLEILERLRDKVTDSLTKKDGLWLINPAPFAALMGKNVGGYQRKNAIVLLLALVLLLSGTFSQERQNRMTQLLRGTPRGRGVLCRKKTLAAVLLTVLVWLLFEAGELRLIYAAYGNPAFSAPIQSFDTFSEAPLSMSLGAGVLVYMLLRLLAMLTAAGVILLLSKLSGQTNAAILLGCAVLVLPACLCHMFYRQFDYLSFSLLLSPLEASVTVYALTAAAACALLCLSCRAPSRRAP